MPENFIISDPAFDDVNQPWDLTLYDSLDAATLDNTIRFETASALVKATMRFRHSLQYPERLLKIISGKRAKNYLIEVLTHHGDLKCTLENVRDLYEKTTDTLSIMFYTDMAMESVYSILHHDLGCRYLLVSDWLSSPVRYEEPGEWERLFYAYLGSLRGETVESIGQKELRVGKLDLATPGSRKLEQLSAFPRKIGLNYALNCYKILANLVRLRYLLRLKLKPIGFKPIKSSDFGLVKAVSDWCFMLCTHPQTLQMDLHLASTLLEGNQLMWVFFKKLSARPPYEEDRYLSLALGKHHLDLINLYPESTEYIKGARKYFELAAIDFADNQMAKAKQSEEKLLQSEEVKKKRTGKARRQALRNQKMAKMEADDSDAPTSTAGTMAIDSRDTRQTSTTNILSKHARAKAFEGDSDEEAEGPERDEVVSLSEDLSTLSLADWTPSPAWKAMAKVYLAENCRRTLLIPLRDKLYLNLPADFTWKNLLGLPQLLNISAAEEEEIKFCIKITTERNVMLKSNEILSFIPDEDEAVKLLDLKLKINYERDLLSFLLSLNFQPKMVYPEPKFNGGLISEQESKSGMLIMALHRLCELTQLAMNSNGKIFCEQIRLLRNPLAHPRASPNFIANLATEYRRHFA